MHKKLILTGGIAGGAIGAVLFLAWSGYNAPPESNQPSTPSPFSDQETYQQVQDSTTLAHSPAIAPPETRPEDEEATNNPETWNGGDFAPNLIGTDIDGQLAVDENGNLIVAIDVKDFYDYFLSAVGDRSLEDVLAEMDSQFTSRLPPEAAKQAQRLLLDYVSYQQQMGELMARPLVENSQQNTAYYAQVMADSFEELKNIRRQHFPPDVVDAFFGLEEAYGEYAVQTMLVRADASLSEPERLAKLESMEALLPEQLVSDAKAAEERNAVADSAQEAYQAGLPPEEIRQLLDGVYSTDEIDSLLTFYENEASWQQRTADYFANRKSLEKRGLQGAELEAALGEYRDAHFSERELMRLRSEEAIEQRKTPAS